ncbi:MAG: DUF427 domain-containing protein [Mycobacteriales bacterium]
MTLTLSHGPLSGRPPPTVNYEIEGPQHRLFFQDFPRRVRAVLAGETVADTRRGKLLHETGILPQLYVPERDIRADLLAPTGHSTHCPFKGDASYWSVSAGERSVENAVWAYQDPVPESGWLHGYRGIYWDAMDAWLDEDEQVTGHLCDPYHRVDIRRTSRAVRVLVDGAVIAESGRSALLSETGLPNRHYIPRDDVSVDLLEHSDTTTVCPYKGTTTYWSLRLPDRRVEDVAWSYPDPLDAALKVREYLCFSHDAITVEIDGEDSD